MTIKLTTTDTELKITNLIISVCSPIFNFQKQTSNINNLFSSIASIFKINVDQLNQAYNRIFIDTVIGQDLDNYINDLTKIKRKTNESDNDYRNRYYKFVFQYNSSENEIRNIVFDVTGQNPKTMIAGSSRTAFWGEPNNVNCIAKYYYNNILSIPTLWSGTNGAFTGYIFFNARPNDILLQELINTIEYVRCQGTIIYLVFPDSNNTVFEYHLVSTTSSIETTNSDNNMQISSFGSVFNLQPTNDKSGNVNSILMQTIRHYNPSEIFEYLFQNLSFSTDNSLITTIQQLALLSDRRMFQYYITMNSGNFIDDSITHSNMTIINNEPDRLIIHTRFIGSYHQVFSRNEDGSNVTQLTFDASDKFGCKFSSDYTAIIYDTSQNGKRDIWKMNINGSNPINLTNIVFGNCFNGDLSFEQNKVCYTKDDNNSYLFFVNTILENKINTIDTICKYANFSTNDKIIFQSETSDNSANYFKKCNYDGSNLSTIIQSSNSNSDTNISLSNDKNYLVWNMYVNSSELEIIMYNLTTQVQETITTNNSRNKLPKLSPSNKDIIYVALDNSGNRKLWKVNVLTKVQIEFTNDVAQVTDNYPDWGYKI